jgi:hypothetical protein
MIAALLSFSTHPICFTTITTGFSALGCDVLTVESLDWIAQGYERILTFRTNWYPFTLRYANSLIFSMPNAVSCLRVIDPISSGDARQLQQRAASPQSNTQGARRAGGALFAHRPHSASINRLVQPPLHIFGPPPDDWCQVFQRADLARQQPRLERCCEPLSSTRYLTLDPSREGFPTTSPRDPSELLPFEEAFRMLGFEAEAAAIRAVIESESAEATFDR